MAFSCSSMTSSSSNNTATSITSSSSSSSSSPSSYYSSPCPSPPHPHAILPSSDHHSLHDKSKVSVPFLWEEKPGISKPDLQSSHNTANILYPSSTDPINCSSTTTRPFGPCSSKCIGTSLEYLPPPPARLSHAFLSQPTRVRRGGVPAHSSNKLLPSHAFSAQRPQLIAGAFHSFKKPSSSKYDDSDDPFFLALKACTIKDSKLPGRIKEKTSFDGFQASFRGLFKSSTKKDHKSSKGSSATKEQNEDMSYTQHLYRRELLVVGSKLQANVNGLGAKAASEIDSDTSSQVLAQRKDKQGTNRSSREPRDQANVLKKAHKLQGNLVIANKNPSKDSVLLGVGEATQGKPLQGGVARKAIPARKEELADEAEQVFVKAKARNSAKVVDVINVNNKHSNPGIFTDMLGCRSAGALPFSLMKGPTNNIHPSFIFPRKLFTFNHD